MANLSEQESWIDGIYQLETSDPVVAGPGGISNRQAEQLASRTTYLKKMQETTGDSLQAHLAASDPHAQYAPKNSPALTGTPTAPTTAQTANNTQIATTAFVKTAIAALINGSPAALDTLQELANALGNDPHFSTTILNAIADVKTDAANKLNAHASVLDAHPRYAPKDSPAFTGTPTAPTAASNSNNTQLATTAFVKAAVAALVNGSPAALDTLQELAAALGNDPNFSTTILNALSGKQAKDQNGADIPNKVEFRRNLELVRQAQYGASQDEVLVARWCGGVGKRTSDFLPANTQVGDFRYNGVWYGLVGATGATDIPSNGTIYNMFAHNTGNYGAQFWFSTVDEPASFRYRIVSNGGVGVWREVMTLDSDQKVNSTKTFTKPPVFQSSAQLISIIDSNVPSGTVGRSFDISVTNTSPPRFVFARRSDPGIGVSQQYVELPIALSGRGVALVTDVNVVADSRGYYKTRGSAEIEPISINDLAGIPLPFPGAVAPTGWLKCNGQAFDKTLYPILASRYPSGVLPDLRGEFVRGWDDGRGADASRTLLSAQGDAIRNIVGTIGQLNDRVNTTETTGVFDANKYTGAHSGLTGGNGGRIATFDASKVVPTAAENRPRNIAFNYIVRAA
ncbi:phage tail protein [Pectobacterium aroidearum]|uniref:phage tail protein n=1 Tax=Pectobacterium aroidearum TaxID=1201031 RepID=UPI0026022C07|nr:tail fiber protein [Pectobacterium aroidearum]WKA64709.1 tail fiber protein [Pectobacterium aroidearum]